MIVGLGDGPKGPRAIFPTREAVEQPCLKRLKPLDGNLQVSKETRKNRYFHKERYTDKGKQVFEALQITRRKSSRSRSIFQLLHGRQKQHQTPRIPTIPIYSPVIGRSNHQRNQIVRSPPAVWHRNVSRNVILRTAANQ